MYWTQSSFGGCGAHLRAPITTVGIDRRVKDLGGDGVDAASLARGTSGQPSVKLLG